MPVSPILEINQVAPTQIDKVPAINDAVVKLEAAFNSQISVNMAAGNTTLSFSQYSRNQVFKCTGLPSACKLTIPLVTPTGGLPAYRVFLVSNQSSAFTLSVGGATGAIVNIPSLSTAMLQSDGLSVTSYGAGGAGPVGGAISIMYSFDTGLSNADPGPGKLRLNNGTQNGSTAIYLDVLDYNGTDWSSVLDTLGGSSSVIDGQIRLFDTANTAAWIMFNMTALVAQTGYRELSVTPIGSSSASPFALGTVLGFAFSRTGDSGAAVLTAVNTWTARQHTPPVTLTDAATIVVDFNLGNQFSVVLAGNRTMGNPSNCLAGDNGNIVVRQDGTGSRTLTFASNWFPLGGAAGTLSTPANTYDIISYFAIGPSHITYGIQKIA